MTRPLNSRRPGSLYSIIEGGDYRIPEEEDEEEVAKLIRLRRISPPIDIEGPRAPAVKRARHSSLTRVRAVPLSPVVGQSDFARA